MYLQSINIYECCFHVGIHDDTGFEKKRYKTYWATKENQINNKTWSKVYSSCSRSLNDCGEQALERELDENKFWNGQIRFSFNVAHVRI